MEQCVRIPTAVLNLTFRHILDCQVLISVGKILSVKPLGHQCSVILVFFYHNNIKPSKYSYVIKNLINWLKFIWNNKVPGKVKENFAQENKGIWDTWKYLETQIKRQCLILSKKKKLWTGSHWTINIKRAQKTQ